MKFTCVLVLMFGTLAVAQSAPPEIQQLNNFPGAAELWIRYCGTGKKGCVARRAICYGGCCNQNEADSMGYACSGDIAGTVPRGFKYVGWVCRLYNPADKPIDPLSGNAGKIDPCPNSKNPR